MIDENGDDISEEDWLNKIYKKIHQIMVDRYADEFRNQWRRDHGIATSKEEDEHGDS